MFISFKDGYRHHCYKMTIIDYVYWRPGENDFVIRFSDGDYQTFYFKDSFDAEAMYNHVVDQLKGKI